MSYKVAVASTDGKFVNEHFGRAEKFMIYEIHDDGTYKFLETRDSSASCIGEGNNQNARSKVIDLISDVKAVLVANVGPGAIDDLINNDIKPYATSFDIDSALNELIKLDNKS
ncbi:NifX-like protein [Methanobrevibacter arboriphilus JCM 13429 = DSM 1125]|uniref:NifX-like protein n=1 Tax=Methanobrevibacter arboriphilus JCM 13429 = DSM 1125 TaxID=1300164 RepID=A0A1V6N127_METAZ|nr:NifB/NifX family molybdenum-iron cluster-binding protein [Methanobrevibacter arboriphilus]OQD58344.1 NifX-like protein [Methanobrevibacter arboriphilus JCM 13429 = DSM 1125]